MSTTATMAEEKMQAEHDAYRERIEMCVKACEGSSDALMKGVCNDLLPRLFAAERTRAVAEAENLNLRSEIHKLRADLAAADRVACSLARDLEDAQRIIGARVIVGDTGAGADLDAAMQEALDSCDRIASSADEALLVAIANNSTAR